MERSARITIFLLATLALSFVLASFFIDDARGAERSEPVTAFAVYCVLDALPVAKADRGDPRKASQLETLAVAIAAEVRTRSEAAALIAIGWNESRFALRVHEGTDRGPGRGPFQLEGQSRRYHGPFVGLDLESTRNTVRVALDLWRHSWQCGRDLAARFTAYAGKPCSVVTWPTLKQRVASYHHTLYALTRAIESEEKFEISLPSHMAVEAVAAVDRAVAKTSSNLAEGATESVPLVGGSTHGGIRAPETARASGNRDGVERHAQSWAKGFDLGRESEVTVPAVSVRRNQLANVSCERQRGFRSGCGLIGVSEQEAWVVHWRNHTSSAASLLRDAAQIQKVVEAPTPWRQRHPIASKSDTHVSELLFSTLGDPGSIPGAYTERYA